MATYKERMRELRNSKGFSQEQMAKELNKSLNDDEKISRSSYASYEQGTRKPSLEFLELFADYFNVDLDYLAGRQDYPNRYKDIILKKDSFINPEEAMKFILEQQVLMAYGGYDLETLSDEQVLEIANDILYALKLSVERHKRRNKEN